jgi:pimeloyl-ACP methyl ester carboxylesterase
VWRTDGRRPRRRCHRARPQGSVDGLPGPVAHQAADELPAALVALRDQLPVDNEPIGILGGSLGGAVALEVLTAARTPIKAVALVNPAVRIRSVVELVGPHMTDSRSSRVTMTCPVSATSGPTGTRRSVSRPRKEEVAA